MSPLINCSSGLFLAASQNRPKPPTATKNNEKTLIDLYLFRFQVNYCGFQVEFVNLSLKPAMVDLESTQVRIDSSFPVICSGFWRFGGARKGPNEQLISGINKACPV